MKNRKDDSEYQQALRRLIDQKVVSEKTAEFHLSQIRKQPEVDVDSNNENKVEKPKRSFKSKFFIGFTITIFLILFYLISR